jgi:hypothetical protein
MTSTKPTIYLVFVDDWELSGNGSGDVGELQFEPMRQLLSIYKECGIHGSFNAEVMQQITFRQKQDAHPELKEWADEWDESVKEALRQRHDVQLHIHPQWQNAKYNDGRWQLTSDWSILNYSADDARRMLQEGKEFLEGLLRPVDPNYRCLAFRSGAWCIAPSPFMLNLLAELGIVFDMSIVAGVRYDTRNVKLDYTSCEEDFLPYYPVMTDARKVSNKIEPIICVPTNCFYAPRRQVFQQHVKKVRNKIKQRVFPGPPVISESRSAIAYGAEWEEAGTSKFQRVYEKGIRPYFKGKHFISDLAQLDYPLLTEMLGSIRRRAHESGEAEVPVILENHTKDVGNFSDIRRFLSEVARAPDIRFLTLTELARKLREGRFRVRTANH